MPSHGIKGDFPDDPARALDWALRLERIVELRSKGLSPAKIVKKLAAEGHDVTIHYVHQLLREYAVRVRDRVVDMMEDRFAEHDARLEHLYEQVQAKLDKADVLDVKLFSALVVAAIRVLERQAKLLGLDKTKAGPGGPSNDWLDRATPAELATHAKKLGINLPQTFVAN